MSVVLISSSTWNRKSSYLIAFCSGSLFNAKNFPVNVNSGAHGITIVSFFDLTIASSINSNVTLWLAFGTTANLRLASFSADSVIDLSLPLVIWYRTNCSNSSVPSIKLNTLKLMVLVDFGATFPTASSSWASNFCRDFDRSGAMKTEMEFSF